MERESELRQHVDNVSGIESDRKTLSPILFQQLRKKFGNDIDFRAQTPIVNDALQAAAAAKKTSRAKKKKKSPSVAYDRFSRAYNRFSRAYNRFSRAYNRFSR